MATYLLIIAVPLEASLPTLVCRTISICSPHAELEMNIGFTGRRQSRLLSPRRYGQLPTDGVFESPVRRQRRAEQATQGRHEKSQTIFERSMKVFSPQKLRSS
jgi:hypothetical protein